MIASHANDSYFWVVTQMSGFSVEQGYKLQTLGTLVVGVFSSLTVILLSLILIEYCTSVIRPAVNWRIDDTIQIIN
jgi:uncharacterized membrane protein